MISTQVLANCIEELKGITRVNLGIFDLDGQEVASTFEENDVSREMV